MSNSGPPTPRQRTLAKRRYFALGVFVQEFERMVDATRQVCISAIDAPVHNEPRISIILTSRVMTAQPLFEVMRGIIGQCMRYRTFTDNRDKQLVELVKQIGTDYHDLVETRNKLLHGTWWLSPDDLSVTIQKFKGRLPGGISLDIVPTSAREYIALAKRCRTQTGLILTLAGTIMNNDFDPNVAFIREQDGWRLRARNFG